MEVRRNSSWLKSLIPGSREWVKAYNDYLLLTVAQFRAIYDCPIHGPERVFGPKPKRLMKLMKDIDMSTNYAAMLAMKELDAAKSFELYGEAEDPRIRSVSFPFGKFHLTKP